MFTYIAYDSLGRKTQMSDPDKGLWCYCYNICGLGLSLILLAGCSYFVSWDDAVKGGVGRPIDSMLKLDGEPSAIIPLPGGNREYKYHLKKIDPSCIHYWIVNPEGIIVSYRYEGRCRPIG